MEIIGKKFGKLTVLEELKSNKANDYHKILKCKCDCGNITYKRKTNVINGKVLSCGCFAIEQTKKRSTKHGCFGTRIYGIWNGILQRTKYKSKKDKENYWGRGINVCKEWEDFINFKKWALDNGYDDKLTIDRIDVDGDYSPENCRWITKKEQSNNRRNNVKYEYNGEILTQSQWSERIGIDPTNFKKRVDKYGLKKAIETPKRKMRSKKL